MGAAHTGAVCLSCSRCRGQCVVVGESNTARCQPFCETKDMEPCICGGQPCVAWSCAALCDEVLCSPVWRGLVPPCLCGGARAVWWCPCCVVVHGLCGGACAVWWCTDCVVVPVLCGGARAVWWCTGCAHGCLLCMCTPSRV